MALPAEGPCASLRDLGLDSLIFVFVYGMQPQRCTDIAKRADAGLGREEEKPGGVQAAVHPVSESNEPSGDGR